MRVEANQINQNILEMKKRQELEKLELERIKAQAIAAKAKAAREDALAAQRRAAAMERHQRAMSQAQWEPRAYVINPRGLSRIRGFARLGWQGHK